MSLFELLSKENIFICAGFLLVSSGIYSILRSGKKPESGPKKPGPEQKHLEDISPIWVIDKDGKAKADLAILTSIWRNEKLVQANKNLIEVPEFNSPRIQSFYKKRIAQATYFNKSILQHNVCIRLLEILDKDGDVPSVVKVNGDHDAQYAQKDKTSFELLRTVNLRNHSLNVAEEMIARLDNQKMIIPSALIAALAHDIGKIEATHGELYKTGNHPLVSVNVLQTIDGFLEMPRHEEVARAIASHHSKTEGVIGQALLTADSAARKTELHAINAKQLKARNEELRQKMIDQRTKQKEEEEKVSSPTPAPAENQEQEQDPEKLTKQPEVEVPEPETVAAPEEKPEASDALDLLPLPEETAESAPPSPVEAAEEKVRPVENSEPDTKKANTAKPVAEKEEVLEELPAPQKDGQDEVPEPEQSNSKEQTVTSVSNSFYAQPDQAEEKEHKPSVIDLPWLDGPKFLQRILGEINKMKGPKFQAFSMHDGLVYVQAGLIMDLAVEMAREAGDTSLDMVTGDAMKQDVILTVIDHFRKTYDAIDNDLLKEGFIGAHFRLYWDNGRFSPKPLFYVPFRADALGDLAEMESNKPKRIRNIVKVVPMSAQDREE